MNLELFNILIWIWISVAIVIVPILFRVTAPYGRHSKETWGPMINNKLGWFIMEVPSLIIFSIFIIRGRGIQMDFIGFLSILYMFHYFYRSIIFPLMINTGSKKMPLVIAMSAIFFNFVNGSVNGYWLGTLSENYPMDWVYDIRFIAGVVLFIFGFVIHFYHDRVLIQLRRTSNNEYQIPNTGLFKYISCPNYFGEILEWLGYALMCWSLPAFSFFIWTGANLIPRAYKHHQWYREKFKDYPKERRALIPFIS